jgi:hypothetical protein
MKDIIKCIAKKYVATHDWCGINEGDEYVVLFFPVYHANALMIESYQHIGQHSVEIMDYFNDGVRIPIPEDLKREYENNYDCKLVEG